MKRSTTMKQTLKPIVVACALALGAGQANALDVYLIAKSFTQDLPLSGGGTQPTTMWGYALDDIGSPGACYNAGNPADAACTGATATAPGPRITIDPADPVLNIYLTNLLDEPTSIVIPGQQLPLMGPTWDDGTTGGRTSLTQKVRSYGVEAAANGGTQVYSWAGANAIANSGTLMYHTGTWPQKQLYMGLAGVITKDADVGNVLYDHDGIPASGDEVTYANELILFYHDVDTDFNANVVAGTLDTAIHRHPGWYMINGQSYQTSFPDILYGEDGVTPLTTAGPTLLRFVSAASEKHVPVLQGLYGTIHAEDGIPYTYEDGTGIHTAPRQQYSIGLPPLKTKDVIVQPTFGGTYAVYDGNGNMTNPSDPGDFFQGDEIGGMIRKLGFNLGVGGNQPPIANADPITIQIPEVLGGATTSYQVTENIDVLANDMDPDGDAITLGTAIGFPDMGAIPGLTLQFQCITGSGCALSLDSAVPPSVVGGETAQFSYDIWTSANPGPFQGSVDLTVQINTAPDMSGVNPIGYTTNDILNDSATIPLTDLVAGASDAEGDTVSVVDNSVQLATVPATNATLSCEYVLGTCTIDYSADPTAPQTLNLTYDVTDGLNVVENQTISVSLLVPGVPNPIDDGPFTLSEIAGANLASNDFNLPPTYGLMIVTGPTDGTATVANDGTFTYVPNTTLVTDSFTYCITDGVTLPEECIAGSPEATVTLQALAAPDLVAIGGKTYTTDEDAVLDVLAANGLLIGESPINGGTLAVVVDDAPTCANTAAGSFTYDGTTGEFHYEPLLDWNSVNAPTGLCTLADGPDTITYHLEETYNDGGNFVTISSNTVTAEITVNPVNDAPVAVNDIFYVQDASTAVLDGQGEPVSMTFSVAAAGVLLNDTDLENDGLLATEVNDPGNLDPALGIDGSMPSFAIDPTAVGILTSVEYEASDLMAQSNIATADIVRQVSVTRASYLQRGNPGTGNDRWRLRGVVDTTIPTTGTAQGVRVYLVRVDINGTPSPRVEIVPTATGNNNGRIRSVGGQHVWGINVNGVGNNRPDVELPDGNDYLEIEVVDLATYPEAVYNNVPFDIEP
ncbi:MAG: Ig-like domain-containing protein [Candidatus Thiodiazotropha weberae]|nr:Ig-like domain-containing protein [Candidatus Thiodiazotropha lotti]MCG8019721.1 Ig-like domain-containing protein [Candidatus Thiodiazotropha lotti]MCW4217020.1 Ig-like domain-containing protein [Candidatus Thiodiazotropha lotti]